MLSANVLAADRIVLLPLEKTNPMVISGDVADYTAERIEIHLTVGKPVHEYNASRVVSVDTVQTDAHRAGVQYFLAGELSEAEQQLQQALQSEPRPWVRREILGWLIKVAMRQGDRARAGRLFLQIVADEPAPREYALAPLVWGPAMVDSNLQQHGRLWMTGTTPAERLLGASMLLLDPRYSETAQAELDRLAREGDLRVAALARAQLWRLRIGSPIIAASEISANELASWEQTIERLPVELRSGPYYLLGRAALQRSEYDRAAAAFMWLPTVYRENESLAAQALLGAATALVGMGRREEAQRLSDELTRDYEWSPAASQARALLTETQTPPESTTR